MKSLRGTPLYVLALTLLCAGLLSTAPTASANPAEDMAALKNFTLNENYLHRWIAVREAAKAKGIPLGVASAGQMRSGHGHMPPLSTMVKHVDSTKGADKLLAKHDMTSRQFVLGSMAIMMGQLNVVAEKMGGSGQVLNQKNVDFVRNHMGEFKAYLRHH